MATEVIGRLVPLSGGRMVFLAKHPERLNTRCVAFKNEDGDDTLLFLSAEALDALVAMHADPAVGQPECSFPFKPEPLHWRAVAFDFESQA